MTELLLIFVVALLVFGAKRLPEIARGLGQGIREFRHATNEITRELQIDDRQPLPRQTPPPASVAYQPPPPVQEPQSPPPATPTAV